jgi:MarR family transcriptional regulator, organic hydroperoxide resistance regulator
MTAPRRRIELDEQLCFALYAASRAVVRSYGPLLEPAGLTYPQYVTMLALWEAPDGRMPMAELCRRLHLDSGTMTPLLKRLEGLGLVARQRSTLDERAMLIEVTDAGHAVQAKVEDVPYQLFSQVDMPAGTLVALRDTLVQLTDQLEK